MTGRRVVAIVGVVLTFLLAAAAVALWFADHALAENALADVGGFVLAMATYAIVGGLIAWRRPEHRTGWLLLAIGVGLSVVTSTDHYSRLALDLRPGSLPGGIWAAWLNGIVGFGLLIPAIALFLQTFPTGEPISPRWRVVARAVVVVAAFNIVTTILLPLPAGGELVNPTGVGALAPLTAPVEAARGLVLLAIALPSLASIVVRFRRSAGTERLQMRWLAFVGAVCAALLIGAVGAGAVGVHAVGDLLGVTFLLSLVLGIPIAAGIALLRHRLHDIDLVVSKTIVYSGMAAFITIVYVAIVVGAGSIFGHGDRPSIPLSIVATTIVAIAFQPARGRLQRLANRLVYGQRATPYEVLSAFADKAADTFMLEEVLPEMARMLADGTGSTASVWLAVGDELVPAASWPTDGRAPEAVPIDAGVKLPSSSLSVPVRSDDDLLGVLTIDKPRGTPVTPQDVRLVEDLATQAGLVLRNVRLVEELKASRQRLVAAQTEERRRLERDLHDGAQQRLVTMALSLRLARDRAAAHDDPVLAGQIQGAEGELAKSLAELRELARGIHPAVLTNSGLAAALASLADRSLVPTDVRIVPEGRFPPDVEAAAYFVVSEALANAAKHAGASAATVSVSRVGSRLVVEVSDDGVGGASLRGTGLRGLKDRVAALGGHLRIESPSGHGTKVAAEIPCE